jgi:hypothetical protein
MGQSARLTHRPDTVDAVVARLHDLAAALPEQDGLAVFHRVYLGVLGTAGRRLPAGRSDNARTAATLDVRLTERYLAAVDGAAEGRRAPACWRPLLQLRRHPGVRPAQFALAVVDTCRSLGCEPADLKDEFDDVGDILLSLEERVREDLLPPPDLLRITDPLTHLLGSWSLERAREAAWAAARVLWALRELPEVAEEFTRRLDATVGFASRMLLTPLPD